MNEITLLSKSEKQLSDLETAITEGDFSVITQVLGQQAITLHMVGLDFLKKSSKSTKLRYQQACTDIAIRAFG